MKKLLSTIVFVMMTLLCVMAQPPQNEGPKGPRPGGPGGPGMDPAKIVEYMDKELSLSEDQKSQLTKIMTTQQEEMKSKFKEMEEEGEFPSREEMMEMHKKRTEQIKSVLTDEQKAKYDEMMKKQRPGPGQGRPQNPPQNPPQEEEE